MRALVIVIWIFLAACATPATPVLPVPTSPPEIIQVVATPSPTATMALPMWTPTLAPAPTAFATAPSAGQAAIVPILMYHHLAEVPANSTELVLTWTVAPKNFDAQMNWLAQHSYHTVTMAQLVAHLTQNRALPSKPVIISFDDGWEDQYVSAVPALRRYNFIGTFFVYTTPLDHNQFLTWGQLQEMSAAGMDIQSHTQTHPHLRDLPPEAAYKEITDSKSILEKRLGKPVIAFGYPFGEYNQATIDMLKRAGYTAAVSLAAGYKQRADDLFTLHRIRVSYNDTLDDFAKRLPQ